ncbi:MAG: NUDIX hydrolase [Actinomycetota bacterium]
MEVPRPAATVVVAREGDPGPEVLVLRRGAGQRFLPGFVAFPGGAIDPGDAAAARRWFGSEAEADVARACAVRELAEELGIAMTAHGLVAADAPLDAVESAPPRADDLVEVSRWVAPEPVAVRYDARFFAVRAGHGLDPRPDGVEAASAWWVTPAALLADEPALYHPTWSVLSAIAGCGDVGAILGSRIAQVEIPDGWTPDVGAVR